MTLRKRYQIWIAGLVDANIDQTNLKTNSTIINVRPGDFDKTWSLLAWLLITRIVKRHQVSSDYFEVYWWQFWHQHRVILKKHEPLYPVEKPLYLERPCTCRRSRHSLFGTFNAVRSYDPFLHRTQWWIHVHWCHSLYVEHFQKINKIYHGIVWLWAKKVKDEVRQRHICNPLFYQEFSAESDFWK